MKLNFLCAPYADLLGRKCWVKRKKKVYECVITAVSWKGAVAVRKVADIDSGKGSWWVHKDNRERLVWLRRKDVPEGLEVVE